MDTDNVLDTHVRITNSWYIVKTIKSNDKEKMMKFFVIPLSFWGGKIMQDEIFSL